jgi:hypothetical protein
MRDWPGARRALPTRGLTAGRDSREGPMASHNEGHCCSSGRFTTSSIWPFRVVIAPNSSCGGAPLRGADGTMGPAGGLLLLHAVAGSGLALAAARLALRLALRHLDAASWSRSIFMPPGSCRMTSNSKVRATSGLPAIKEFNTAGLRFGWAKHRGSIFGILLVSLVAYIRPVMTGLRNSALATS